MRESFVFYQSYYEAISDLDEEQQQIILDAIFRYALYDEEPNLSGSSSAIFKLIKPQIDANMRKYENGKKGGRPAKSTGSSEETEEQKTETKTKPNHNQTKTKTKPKHNQTITKTKPNETKPKPNVNVNVNVNGNGNGNGNDNGLGFREAENSSGAPAPPSSSGPFSKFLVPEGGDAP